MKNGKLTYFLLPIVLLIWGYVGYSIYNYGEKEEKLQAIVTGNLTSSETGPARPRQLSLDYPDPFLGRGARYRQASSGTQSSGKAGKKSGKKAEPKTEVNWGDISYQGFVNNRNSGKIVALLTINGKQHLAESEKIYDGIAIRNIRKDSVELAKENETRWYRKKQ